MIRNRIDDWNRVLVVVLAGLGVAVILASVAVALLVPGSRPADGPRALGVLAVLAGMAVAAWKLWRDPASADVDPPPWQAGGTLVDGAPERVPEELSLSGTALSRAIERAGHRARTERTVEAAIADVRPMLRQTVIDALVAGGDDPEAVRQALAEGTWTDDPEAAAVLDESVTPPPRPLRRRVWAWLYPERALRRRVGRATAAVAAAADDALPPVVGQRAPRPVPVAYPSADELRAASEDADAPTPDPAVDGSGAAGSRGADGGRSGQSTDPTNGEYGGGAGLHRSPTGADGRTPADWTDVEGVSD